MLDATNPHFLSIYYIFVSILSRSSLKVGRIGTGGGLRDSETL